MMESIKDHNDLTRNTPIGVVVREPSAVNHYFCGVCPQIWGLGYLGGAKVIPSDSPPSICYFALESSEYLKPPGCRERFSIFVGFCPPKLGFGGHLGGQKLYHRIARPRFAKTPWDQLIISNRLATMTISLFSWGSTPQNWGLGALRGEKVTPSDSPPSIC